MEFILILFPLFFTYIVITEVWIMTRISARQIAKFEAKLQEVTRDSVAVNHTLLAKLAAKRDAHLASLRWILYTNQFFTLSSIMFKVFYLTNDGESVTVDVYSNREDADKAVEIFSERLPNAYVDYERV